MNAYVQRDIAFTRWLFRAYLLILFLLPVPLGSNRPLFWAVFVALVAGLALVWAVGWLAGVARWPEGVKRAKWALLALVLFVVWGGVKVGAGFVELSRPQGGLLHVGARDVRGEADEGRPQGGPVGARVARDMQGEVDVGRPQGGLVGARVARDMKGEMDEGRPQGGLVQQGGLLRSVDLSASADALLLSIGLLLLVFLTIALVRSKRRALLVLYTLVLAGLIQAIYGSLMMLSGVEWGFFEPKQFGRGLATGTFVNRNHYANLLVLSLSAGAGLLLAQMDLRGAPNMRARLRSFLQATLGPKARLRIFMVITVIALVLTRSRMGNASFFAALTIAGVFALWRLRRPSRPLVVLVVSVIVIDILVIGTWFGVEQVIDRIQKTVQVQDDEWVVQDKNRIDADRESLAIIRERPLAGWGGGSFYTVYPAWRGDDQMFMDHAHNDYLEFAVEYGLVGLALLAWFMGLCCLRAARGLEDRDQEQVFGISFAALMAMTAMMIHATVDFSLQIPANAAWFVVLCVLPFAVRAGASSATLSESSG